MKLFKKKEKREELALLFDISSSSIGGALFYMQKDGVPKIIYSTREPIKIELEVNVDHFFNLTLNALKHVATKVCMSGIGAPTRIFMVLSSPWYASQTRTIRLEKGEPFLFTDKLADELTQKELALFEDEYLVKGAHALNKIRPIELKNMKTILNGYATNSPIGQKTKEIEMVLFISMSQEQFLGKMESVINQHFPHRKIEFVSFVMASFTVARDMFVNQESFLLINIGGEITDISMVKKDILRESASFPLGKNYIMRSLATELSISSSEAKSMLTLYNEGHLAEAEKFKIEPVITKIKTEWVKVFQETLSTLTNDISIPATIFITVDQDFLSFFSEIIKTEQFNQYTLTESKFRIIFLGTEALHGIALFDDKVLRDPFTIIESIYINRFLS